MSDASSIRRRKTEHLDICVKRPVEFQRASTWLQHVQLVHQAVPSFPPAELNTSATFLGRKLTAPFLIGAMTGGTLRAGRINRDLARVAADMGVGLALGSQRAMFEDDRLKKTYRVRDVAPDILLLGNIGLSQALTLNARDAWRLASGIGATGLCLHLNSAMELFQESGDRPDGRAYEAIARLAKALGQRLVVKETGCGLSRETASRLADLGVRTVDVAGAGGTSWVRVESYRGGSAVRELSEFQEWGIPTAASLLEVRGLKMRVIASGGLRTGLDLAKSLALGADLGSAALPVLRALEGGGVAEAKRYVASVIGGLRAAMLLTGCRDIAALRRAPVVVSGPLREWAEQRGIGRKSLGR